MAKTVGIGNQNFEVIQENRYFYVDKTQFIEQWWETGDNVTLITRPRRFGKTLNMSMVEKFFSIQYKDRADLFQDLRIWEHEDFRKLQGTYPVISLSFANVKERIPNMPDTERFVCTEPLSFRTGLPLPRGKSIF